MIYVMSRKFLKKNLKKMAWASDYLILDGENYGVTGRTDAISLYSEYSATHPCAGFCPERTLYGYLLKLKKKETVSASRFDKELDRFLTDKQFIYAAITAMKVLYASKYEKYNALIVLPNVVYSEIGFEIAEAIVELLNVDFECVFTQEEIVNIKKMMDKHLKKKELEVIAKRVEKLQNKYGDQNEGFDDEGYSPYFGDMGSVWSAFENEYS